MLSVIIPTYNRGHIVSRAIDSVLQQTCANIEILVIDDGSTDNTRELINKDYPQVKYFYQPNSGVSSARNLGLTLAKGEFISFLDSDDIIYPKKLEIQATFLEKHPEIDVVYSGWKVINEDGKTVYAEFKPKPAVNVLKKLVWDGYAFPIHAALIRKECLHNIFFDETLYASEDPDFFIQIALDGASFGCTKDILCEYQMTSGSLSKSVSITENSVQIFLNKTFSDSRLPKSIFRNKNKIYARRFFELAIVYLSNSETENQIKKIRSFFQKAEKLDPDILTKQEELITFINHKASKSPFTERESFVGQMLSVLARDSNRFKELTQKTLANLYINNAFQFFRAKDWKLTINQLLKAFKYNPRWLLNYGVFVILIKSISNTIFRK